MVDCPRPGDERRAPPRPALADTLVTESDLQPETPSEDTVLDVRPIIARGDDPFEQIMAAAARLPVGGALVVVNTFEPFPLYDKLGALGFEAHPARLPNGDWRVSFWRIADTSPGATTDQ